MAKLSIPVPLLEATLSMLRMQLPPEGHAMRAPVVRAIAAGANVEPSWVRRVDSGQTPDPGVMRLQALHDYLLTLPPPPVWPEVPQPIRSARAAQ